jgi:hypothetical protein
VQVDVVWHLRGRVIAKVELDEIAFAHFKIHHDLRRVLALDRRRHIRRGGEHRLLLADDFRIADFDRTFRRSRFRFRACAGERGERDGGEAVDRNSGK